MKRNIILLVLTGVFVLFLGLGIPFSSRAYTEEEKAQAKAWLSAHGYSPDAGGASQAYQDYLDGKFDEELGINQTEDNPTEEASTEDAGNSGKDKDAARPIGAKDPKEKKKADKDEKEPAKQTDDSTRDSRSESGEEASAKKENTREKAAGEEASEKETARKDTEEAVNENKTEEAEQKNNIEDEKKQQAIILFQEQKADSYREAGLVIFLSVMLVAIIAGIIMLLK